MKAIKLTILVAFIAPTGIAMAQSGDMKGMDMKSISTDKTPKTTSYKAVGVVKKVDPTKGTVSFAHEPVKELNWPAMTMTFIVKDKALLGKLVTEKKVAFEFVKRESDYVVTAVK